VRIAVVTDDQNTISQHFGRAHYYLVFTVEDGQVMQQELRDKLGHDQFQQEEHGHHDHDHDHQQGHGLGQHSQDKHSRMMANIGDCQVLLAGGTLAPALRCGASAGVGLGARASLQAIGVKPILTNMHEIDAALQAYLAGELEDQPRLLH
jgi:predicted Fe-Mo cluster-binding NifX family protein